MSMKLRMAIITGLVCIAAFGIAHADQSNAGNGDGAPPAFVPLAQYGGSSRLASLYSGGTGAGLANFFNQAFLILFSFAGMAAVLRLVYAGYIYMMSDQWTSKQHAEEVIKNVTIGILLLLSMYLILSQINPSLLNLNILQDFTNTQPTATPPAAAPPSATPTGSLGGQPIPGQGCANISTGSTPYYECFQTMQTCSDNYGPLCKQF